MINYVVGGIVFGLMIFVTVRIIKKAKEKSCICGGSCSECPSRCAYHNDEGKK